MLVPSRGQEMNNAHACNFIHDNKQNNVILEHDELDVPPENVPFGHDPVNLSHSYSSYS